MSFDFDPETRRQLGYRLIDRINEYFSSLPDRPVQLPANERSFERLHNRMPEMAEDAAAVLEQITTELIDKGFHVPSANYFGLMNPTPAYIAVLAEALVAALNPQLATMARSQLASKIEQETVRWIGERIWRDEQEFSGTFASGGNEANFTALALALTWRFPDVIEEGVAAIDGRPLLYASSESHHSIDKSIGLLGLGRKALRRIAVNEQMQMNVRALEAAILRDKEDGHKPFCVVATAGTTSSGAIDDVEAIAEICRRHSLWLHVDGAYGAAVVFSDKHRHLVRGIELADSVTIDPHKWLAMPFSAGVLLTSRPEMLERTFATQAPYMPRARGARQPDNARISAQWSRRMNSLKLWLTLRIHGRQAYEELIDRQLRLAAGFAEWLQGSEHFKLAAPQVLPIVNFRLRNSGGNEQEVAAAHAAIVDAVTRESRRWISETRVNGRSVLRMMVISYLTEERHLSELQNALTEAAMQLVTPTRTRA
jgi:aromatic-L-amino-acid decarboxylase